MYVEQNMYLGVLAKVEENIHPSCSLLREALPKSKPLSAVSKVTSLKTVSW